MAKRAPRKRMNKRMRRAIRKSVSAMFMATALLIAAIPVPDNVAAEDITPIYEDGIGSSTLPEADAIVYSVSLIDEDNLGFSSSASTSDGYVITETNGEYFLDLIYKIVSNGHINAIAGYNIDYEPQGGTLTIPLFIAKSYVQFQDADVRAAYINAGTPYTKLQKQYNNYHPENLDGTDEEGNPKYKNDFSKMTETEVLPYARDVYACDCADYQAGYEAAVVHIGTDAGGLDLTAFVPHNESTGEFFSLEKYPIDAIADGAFSTGTFSKKDPTTPIEDGAAIRITNIVFNDRLTIIGDNAFKGMANLRSVDLKAVTTVGNHTFEGCNSLQTVDFGKVEVIGTEAFKDCTSLSSVTLNQSLKKIYPGAFAYCTRLSDVNMENATGENTIEKFAFYDCAGISTLKMSSGTTYVGDGAFAVSSDKTITGNLTSVVFPDNVAKLGKAVLDGRTNLAECTLPKPFGGTSQVTLDAGFFRQCKNLNWVKISGPYANFPENTFVSVTSDAFYVEGPATYDGSDDRNYADSDYYSNPRISAHNAGITYKFTANGVSYFDVAYNYQKKDADGNLVYTTVTDAEGNPVKVPVMVTDYYLINAETGALEKYTPDPDNNEYSEIVIKGDYNGVSVKSIAAGCFDEVKTTATKLTIEDNTISTIGKEAFKDFTALKVVVLGNSVTSIEDSAFAGCDALTDVYFGMDKVTIGSNAFSKNVGTGTIGLTFHGKVENGFEPFDWAMQKDNDLNEAGLRVLYKSLPPSDLATIYDRGASTEETSVVSLIYYPIYNCLDEDNLEYRQEKARKYGLPIDGTGEPEYSIIERVERGAGGDVPDGESLTPEQWFADAEDVEYVNATYNIVIPAGITSIDSPAFYNSQANTNSIIAYVKGDGGSKEAVMNASMNSIDGSVPGLFSGYYEDYPEGSEDAKNYETEKKGNDRVESITMSTVTSIPDYAFDSCERLTKVDLGAACKEIGIAPFRGCTSLQEVKGNDTIICENDIIYTLKEDGTYMLVECLPSRGKNGNSEVSVANDPKLASVSEISESAFVDCQNVISVNLTGCTKLSKIPKDCFKGCISLRNVYLPSTVNYIEEGAFAGLTQIHVRIPAREVYIHKDAFEHGESKDNPLSTVVIESYEDSSAYRYTQDNYIGFMAYNEYEHTVVFLNWDFDELYRTYIQNGQSVRPFLEAQDEPTRSGYKFTGWKSITAGASLDQITADTTFVAQFDKKSGSSGSGSGGSGSNTASGNNGNNSGNNGSSSDSSKLYTLTVVNGSGSGSYVKDANVIITANNPASGKKFKEWVVDTKNATLASTRVTATSFKMPAEDVKVTAVYEDDKSSSSSSNKNGSSVSGNSSTSNRNRTSGSTKVVITRPGISDTDLASAKVNGSKDGFIVKISETAEATAAVEEALINKYGSLDNLRYCAMDISLYDSTGTNKITDTTGYTVDITIPIPDSLREYAGNNKTAAVVNSQLEALSPKFTTIDGVPCVTFRATHFSPYTVYVDTQNLTAGGLDSTPKTGDGIHPKWFLSLGLACISVILFMKKDKKSPKVKVA